MPSLSLSTEALKDNEGPRGMLGRNIDGRVMHLWIGRDMDFASTKVKI